MPDRVLRRPEVEDKIGLCERQLRTLEAEGKFPQRFLIVPDGRAVGWSEVEVDAWLTARIEARERVNKVGVLIKGGRTVAAE